MNEYEKLSDKRRYKIYIQQKFNRKQKLKTKFLTPDLNFSERLNDALEFKNFGEAETFLNEIKNSKLRNFNLRIIIKYFENIVGENINEQITK